MNQVNKLHNYLKKGNTISSLEAPIKLGITSLHKVLFILRRELEKENKYKVLKVFEGKGKSMHYRYWLSPIDKTGNFSNKIT